jgi:hypothetical protein
MPVDQYYYYIQWVRDTCMYLESEVYPCICVYLKCYSCTYINYRVLYLGSFHTIGTW